MRYLSLILVLFFLSCNSDKDKPSIDEKIPVEYSEKPEMGMYSWTMNNEPSLIIGADDEGDEFLFHRVWSAVQLDNKIIVGNSGTHQLRFFDLDGKFLSQTGQNGRGPGDFGDFSTMRIYPLNDEKIVVDDGANDRVQVFDMEGNLVTVQNSIQIEGYGNPSFSRLISDGSHLYWSAVGSAALRGEPGDIIESEYAYHRVNSDNSYDRELVRVTPRRRYVNPIPGGGRHFPFIPFDPEPLVIPDKSAGILVVDGGTAEITRIDTMGVQTGIFRWSSEQELVKDVWEEFKKSYLSGIGDDQMQRYESFLNEILPLPERVPAIDELMVDKLGNIWARRYQVGNSDSRTWDILSEEGKWVTSIQIPSRFTITEIGGDYILGVTYANGFPQIAKYDLLK